MVPARPGGGWRLAMPHALPSKGEGEQRCARAADAMGTSALVRAPSALARESGPCLHMAGGPEKNRSRAPSLRPSPHPRVLLHHRDLLTRFQLTPGPNPLACVARGVGHARRVNKRRISGQLFAGGPWGRQACPARAEGRGLQPESPSVPLGGLRSHAVCRNRAAPHATTPCHHQRLGRKREGGHLVLIFSGVFFSALEASFVLLKGTGLWWPSLLPLTPQ